MRRVYGLTSFAVLLVIILVSVIALIPAERIAGIAARELAELTGRDVRFSGEARAVFYPVIGIRIEGVTIGNADWATAETLVSAESLLVGVRLAPLIAGKVSLRKLWLTEADIALERGRDGKVNWQLRGLTGTLPVDLRISGGSLAFADQQAGAGIYLQPIDVEISKKGGQGRAKITGSAQYRGEEITLSADIARLDVFLSGAVSDLSVDVKSGFGRIRATGRAGLNPAHANLALTADLTALPCGLRLIGQDGDMMLGLANRIGLTGDVTYSGGDQINLRRGSVRFDRNRAAGEFDLDFGERIKVTARLDAEAVDFSGLFGEIGPLEKVVATGWPRTALDPIGLKVIDADIAFSAPSVELGFARAGQTRLRAQLEKGRLALTLHEIAAYGGTLSGEAVVNSRKGLSMSGDLHALGLQLRPFLEDLAGVDQLIAVADLHLKFLTSGPNVEAMMRRVSGKGSARLWDGELVGLDLTALFENAETARRWGDNSTIFSEITGSYVVENGVLLSDDLLIESDLLKARGDGEVEIGTQTLTYRLQPVEGATGLSLRPAVISGPWDTLEFHSDSSGFFAAELAAQKVNAAARRRQDEVLVETEGEAKLRQMVEKAMLAGADKVLREAMKPTRGSN